MGSLLRLALALVALVACNSTGETPASGAKATGGGGGEVRVFAAASLTDAFESAARDFEKVNPGIRVKLSFAGSQSLRTQIENGAAPDVFASANAEHMATLTAEKHVGKAEVFATNELAVVVPASNPAGIASFADLPKARRLVLAGETVPAGAYAEEALNRADDAYGGNFAARVRGRVVSRENHVRQTLQKVVLGEADAAIVYATDAAAAGNGVRTVAIPAEFNVVAEYPIATVNAGKRGDLGRRFIDFLRSEPGQKRLVERGFSVPR